MKKIVFLLPNLEAGGAERVTLNIIEQLDRNKFDIYLILVNSEGELSHFLPNNITIIDLGLKRTLFSLPKFFLHCLKIKPDILFSSLNRTNIIALLSSFGLRNTKVIIREPNMPSKQYEMLPKLTMYLVKLLYSRAFKVIAQTDEMKDEIIGYYNVPKQKTLTMINPLNTNLIDALIKDGNSPYDSKDLNMLAIGSLIERKGFDILLKSMKIVVEEFPSCKLYILGKGIDMMKLIDLTKKLDLGRNVIFEGFQENPYLYLNNADLFILSSLVEGLPNVVLESLYLNTKVVVTDCVPYISRLVKNSYLGEVAKVNDVDDLAEKIVIALKQKDYNPLCDFNFSDFNHIFLKS